MACRRCKSQEERAATWNVNRMVRRSGEVVALYTEERFTSLVLKRRGGSARMIGAIN